jgi:hypothetical protein
MDSEQIAKVEELSRKARDTIRQRRKLHAKKQQQIVSTTSNILVTNRPPRKKLKITVNIKK